MACSATCMNEFALLIDYLVNTVCLEFDDSTINFSVFASELLILGKNSVLLCIFLGCSVIRAARSMS